MVGKHYWLVGEPALRDVVVDPIVELVMHRDRLSRDDVWRAIDRGQQALRARPARGAERVVRPGPSGPAAQGTGGPPSAGWREG